MSKTFRLAALALATGAAVSALPAASADAATTNKGVLLACVTRDVAGAGNISLTADGPSFKQATAGPAVGPQCATWNVVAGQYVVDAQEATNCTFHDAKVTRDGRTRTLGVGNNESDGLFGITNVEAGKTTRVDWVYGTC